MAVDELFVGATKAKLKEVISILEKSGLSNSHILDIVETASNEVVEGLKNEMWQETIAEQFEQIV